MSTNSGWPLFIRSNRATRFAAPARVRGGKNSSEKKQSLLCMRALIFSMSLPFQPSSPNPEAGDDDREERVELSELSVSRPMESTALSCEEKKAVACMSQVHVRQEHEEERTVLQTARVDHGDLCALIMIIIIGINCTKARPATSQFGRSSHHFTFFASGAIIMA